MFDLGAWHRVSWFRRESEFLSHRTFVDEASVILLYLTSAEREDAVLLADS